jgi:hypothetical protein
MFHKRQGIFLVSEPLLGSQEGLCSIESVSEGKKVGLCDNYVDSAHESNVLAHELN